MDLISIVIPVYNTEKYIFKCLESIITQTYTNLEIILIDDGSTDNSGAICDGYKKKDKRITVFHKKNEGLGLTRNLGLELSTGKYICFIDSDDYISSDYIESMYSAILQNKSDVCYCGHTKVHDGVQEQCKNLLAGKRFSGDEILHFLMPCMCGCSREKDNIEMSACMAIYSMSIIDINNIRFSSERVFISEDLLFNLDYLSHSNNVYMSEEIGYYYVSNPISLTRKYNPERLRKQEIMTKEVISRTQKIGIFSECEQRIYNNYMTWVRAIIKTEQSRYKEIGVFETLDNIKKICTNNFVIEISSRFNDRGIKVSSRIVNLMIRTKKVLLLWSTMAIKNWLGI